MSRQSLLIALLVLGLAGCGTQTERSDFPANTATEPPADPNVKKVAGGADPAVVNATSQPQMITYTATLSVVVKDLDAASQEVEKLLAGQKGFVVKSEVSGDPGTPRVATFTLRVPVAGFGTLKEALLALGNVERNAVETQDVTEEFIDVEARIKNLQEQERKLNELLQEKRKEEKLEDVIKVSDRIYVVRGDIERAQGRRNYLLNRVQLSTIHLTLREIKDYKPPTAPTFGTRIQETFASSWESLVDFAKRLVLVGVALAPWAPVWLPLVALGVWGLRRFARLARETSTRTAPHPHHTHRRHVGSSGDLPTAMPPAQSEKPPEELIT
jgi:hypothetical protein